MTAELPCIRCGACATACPARLQPQQLLQDLRGQGPQLAASHGLTECTECALCDATCPSGIALASRFAAAKSVLAERNDLMRRASAARQRYQARAARLERESQERAAREIALSDQATSPDAVAAAIERARLRREQARRPP